MSKYIAVLAIILGLSLPAFAGETAQCDANCGTVTCDAEKAKTTGCPSTVPTAATKTR